MTVEEITFREYDPADVEPVVAIFLSNIPKYFVPDEEQDLRNYLIEHPEDYYVIESGGEIVGAGGIALNSDGTISLCWGMVRNDLIGTGLGKSLTKFRVAKAREKYDNLPIVISTSQHTQGFYEQLGFEMTEHILDGFGPGIDICKMRNDP